jgi:hypothetical protein
MSELPPFYYGLAGFIVGYLLAVFVHKMAD